MGHNVSATYKGVPNKALFEEIRDQWKQAGYEMPVLAFWNLNAERALVPTLDDRGVVLLSGFTTDNLETVMNGDLANFTPAKQLEIILSKPRYDAVETAFMKGLEAERKSGAPTISFAEFMPEEGYSRANDVADYDHDEQEWDDEEYDWD
jgi:hypothetical protein